MNNELVLRNVIGYLFPVETIYVFSALNRSINRFIKDHMTPDLWAMPYMLTSASTCEDVKTILRGGERYQRYIMLNELWLALKRDPEKLLKARAVNGDGLLQLFCRKGEVAFASLLINNIHSPSVLNATGASGMTALHCAAFAKSEPLVRLLIKAHANSGIKDSIGRFPEDWATIQQAHEIAESLRRARKGKHGLVVKR